MVVSGEQGLRCDTGFCSASVDVMMSHAYGYGVVGGVVLDAQ